MASVTSEKIKLDVVRLSFPVIWEPKAFATDQKAKYQATFLLDPSDKAHSIMIKTIKKEAKRIVNEQFGEVPKGLKKCFGLADDHENKKDYDGYEGMFYISTSSTQQPTLADRNRNEVVESDGILYAGCYVNTVITLWCQDHPVGGKGVNANLRIIQFVKDGEAFGNAPARADEELEVIELDDDDDEALDDWEGEDEDDL
jgi:hypothetical protein